MSETVVFLVYADDGAAFVYAGEDVTACERHCAALAATHAGAIVGRRQVGPERWVVRAYFVEPPPDEVLHGRRHGFPYGLTWEPSGAE